MFWNDIKEIKEKIKQIDSKLYLDNSLLRQIHMMINYKPAACKHEGITTEENEEVEVAYTLNHVEIGIEIINEKLNKVLNILGKIELEIPRLVSTINPDGVLEKYDEKIAKVENMLNEFKGCMAIARSSLQDKKELIEASNLLRSTVEYIKNFESQMKKGFEYSLSIHNQHFKIEKIYQWIESQEKPKKKIVRKKTVKKISSSSSS